MMQMQPGQMQPGQMQPGQQQPGQQPMMMGNQMHTPGFDQNAEKVQPAPYAYGQPVMQPVDGAPQGAYP